MSPFNSSNGYGFGDWISDRIAEFKMKRASKLTTDATPEPVAKGATLTMSGKLSRANWET